MGCCESKNLNNDEIKLRIKRSIESGGINYLRMICKLGNLNKSQFNINLLRYDIENSIIVNPLGYSLLLGQTEVFNFIMNELKGDAAYMESIFNDFNTSGLSIICLNNYLSLLHAYLPIFLQNRKNNDFFKSLNLKATLNLKEDLETVSETICPFTPVQLACENGHISIISYLKGFNENLQLNHIVKTELKKFIAFD